MKKILVLTIIFFSCLSANAAVHIKNAEGWLESAFVEFSTLEGYTDYNVYVRPEGGDYKVLDKQLLRSYSDYCRADALGLPAGNYQLKVVPVKDNADVEAQASETKLLAVSAHDRRGFAHFNWHEGVGAYKDNGELKANAQVIYVYKGNAKTVTADIQVEDPKKYPKTTLTGIQAILKGYEKGRESNPLCIRIIGTLEGGDVDEFGSSAEGIQIKCKEGVAMNITIEGVGNDAVIRGFGFLIRSSKSVEMRNLAIMSCLDDGVSLDTDNSNIWLHHLDVFYGKKGSGDKAKGDGAIDVKSDSKYVTVSYCHLWDTGKSHLCGMKSESGPNYICYHHNWFDHSDSRHPRVRTMSVHVFNNYFDGVAKYCVGATTGSSVFVENNYFLNCSHPMLISMQGTDTKNGTDESDAPTFSKENGGIIKAFNNVYAGSRSIEMSYYDATKNPVHFDAYLAQTRDEQVPSTVTAKLGGSKYDNFDTNSSVMPDITPDDPNDIPEIVTGTHGAGRMFHGDLNFSLANFTPSDYEISTELSNLIVSYQSSLQGIFGTEWNNLPDPAPETALAMVTDNSLSFSANCLHNPKGKLIRIYAINGACAGSTSRETVAVDHLPAGTYIAVTKDGALRFNKF
ncbi:MAG: pectate lyase [Paludibacteraceae bacterium]|nr:pectate lyase [Paludibacteraceae bacterium]